MDIAALSENGYILLTMRDVGEADKIIAAFHRQGFENIVKAQDLELLV